MKNKDTKFDDLMLINIFIFVDDACILMREWAEKHWISAGKPLEKPNRVPKITESEMMTILIFYHYSGFKCFEYYYKSMVINDLKNYFSNLPSYNYFIELMERVALPMMILAKLSCQNSEKTEIYYIDSKKIPICDNLRIAQNKVFRGLAQ